MSLLRQFVKFFNSDKAGGLVLVFVTALSLLLANSPWHAEYISFWHFELGGHTTVHWINDGLMTIFFLFIGLELMSEIHNGRFSDLKCVSFPFFGAIGGMAVPAGLFLLFNYGTDTQIGSGIPTATDIAFAVGILSLLGSRVPKSLKIFLTALAIIDDLGAIIIISIFYTTSIAFVNLFIALSIFGLLLFLNRLKVRQLTPYLIGGVAMWYFMMHSGVHPTITGVLLAIAILFGSGGKKSPSYILQNFLRKPVTFIILPLFAIANTCIVINDGWLEGLGQVNSIGIITGLLIGKPLGIWLFTFIGTSLGICVLPKELNWKVIIGGGILAGIGFTMSIFITLLAFDNPETVNNSKIAILVASIVAGTIGYLWLKRVLK